MDKLFWFNPENDLALAFGRRYYTPPRAAVELRRAGVNLPSLWADDFDAIFDVESKHIVPNPRFVPEPWGWSFYTRECFWRAGCSLEHMPDDAALEQIRMLSHRRTSIELLSRLGIEGLQLPVEAHSAAEAFRAIESFGSDAVIKLPWSCSGRGVFYSGKMTGKQLASVVEGGISRQGSVMIEPRYERLRDFAMLFYSDSDCVRFRGLSMFHTDQKGNYSGNIIAPQNVIRENLRVDTGDLANRLEKILGIILCGKYRGWVGVDMMTYRNPCGNICIHPCIEINLRMTMGVAALLAAESGRLPWDKALLRVALPGEILPTSAISFASQTPDIKHPLKKPVIIVTPEI